LHTFPALPSLQRNRPRVTNPERQRDLELGHPCRHAPSGLARRLSGSWPPLISRGRRRWVGGYHSATPVPPWRNGTVPEVLFDRQLMASPPGFPPFRQFATGSSRAGRLQEDIPPTLPGSASQCLAMPRATNPVGHLGRRSALRSSNSKSPTQIPSQVAPKKRLPMACGGGTKEPTSFGSGNKSPSPVGIAMSGSLQDFSLRCAPSIFLERRCRPRWQGTTH